LPPDQAVETRKASLFDRFIARLYHLCLTVINGSAQAHLSAGWPTTETVAMETPTSSVNSLHREINCHLPSCCV